MSNPVKGLRDLESNGSRRFYLNINSLSDDREVCSEVG